MTQSDSRELLFVPLGGAGEIGMNLNLYGLGEPGEHEWIIADLGVTFNNGVYPGVDLILPDPAFIEEHRENLLAIVLTHAHEDHLGAVPYLWPRLRCPIYATPFTASVLARKLREVGLGDEAEITIVPLGARFDIGPFDLELITLTHSIPEPNAVAIRTDLGTVLHTGDWKFDPDPVIGPAADEKALRRLGDEGVLAIVCDSTNVFSDGTSGSEADIESNLAALIGECRGRVAVACFATNVARLETISKAARDNGRDIVIAGRSLERIERAARDNGYLADVPAFIGDGEGSFLPDDRMVIICTGSQGEPRAALARIASDEHPHISLGTGDTVIFSSRIIPGNEAAIGRLHNDLVRRGIKVITANDHFIHVSGHPARDELTHMYQLSRPKVAVPVHGELRHMTEHAQLARECQVETAIVAENGAVVRLAGGGSQAGIIDHAPSGRLSLEGTRLVPLDSEVLRARRRVMWNGSAVVTVVVDEDDFLAATPVVSTEGLFETDDDAAVDEAVQAAEESANALLERHAGDDELEDAVRLAVRRRFRDILGKKPVVKVHLVRP